jgi:hypothetical protein
VSDVDCRATFSDTRLLGRAESASQRSSCNFRIARDSPELVNACATGDDSSRRTLDSGTVLERVAGRIKPFREKHRVPAGAMHHDLPRVLHLEDEILLPFGLPGFEDETRMVPVEVNPDFACSCIKH